MASSASWCRNKQTSPNCTSFLSHSLPSICLCCSSVTRDLETVEFPRMLTYHPAHQAMMWSHVKFVHWHQLCSLCSQLSFYCQVCSLTSAMTALRSSWFVRSVRAFVLRPMGSDFFFSECVVWDFLLVEFPTLVMSVRTLRTHADLAPPL